MKIITRNEKQNIILSMNLAACCHSSLKVLSSTLPLPLKWKLVPFWLVKVVLLMTGNDSVVMTLLGFKACLGSLILVSYARMEFTSVDSSPICSFPFLYWCKHENNPIKTFSGLTKSTKLWTMCIMPSPKSEVLKRDFKVYGECKSKVITIMITICWSEPWVLAK